MTRHNSAWAGLGVIARNRLRRGPNTIQRGRARAQTNEPVPRRQDDATQKIEVRYDDKDHVRAWGRRRRATTRDNVERREERNNASRRREAMVDDDNNNRA